jgi:hypothetical protein
MRASLERVLAVSMALLTLVAAGTAGLPSTTSPDRQ